MARDVTPNFQPRVAEDQGLFYVQIKTAPGEYIILTEGGPEWLAKRELRRIREEMANCWMRENHLSTEDAADTFDRKLYALIGEAESRGQSDAKWQSISRALGPIRTLVRANMHPTDAA